MNLLGVYTGEKKVAIQKSTPNTSTGGTSRSMYHGVPTRIRPMRKKGSDPRRNAVVHTPARSTSAGIGCAFLYGNLLFARIHPQQIHRGNFLWNYRGLFRGSRLDGLCISKNAAEPKCAGGGHHSRRALGIVVLARDRLPGNGYATWCLLAALFSGVHSSGKRDESPDRMDLYAHEQC